MKHPLFSFWLLTISLIKSGSPTPCSLRDLGSGNKVCVCNATYCDTIAGVTDIPEDRFFVFTSNKEGLRFNKTEALYSDSSLKGALELIVNDTKKFQKLLGFGGCFSDSSLINMELLSNETKDHLMRSYFSTTGIEYNMGRVPIGGSDFSTRFYTYDDVGPDPELKNFKLAPEDFELKIPYINKAKEMSERELLLLSSPWSPPNWMKTINITSGFCFLKEEYYDVYSQYLLRFLDEYKKQGLEFWGMTSGNEPSLGFTLVSQINALGWLPWSASDWIADSLGPLLRNSTHNQTLLLAIDDQRLFLPWWLEMVNSIGDSPVDFRVVDIDTTQEAGNLLVDENAS